MEDPELEVVRIKNRLDVAYDSRLSGGYRDVAINVRVVNEETRRRGVDIELCSGAGPAGGVQRSQFKEHRELREQKHWPSCRAMFPPSTLTQVELCFPDGRKSSGKINRLY